MSCLFEVFYQEHINNVFIILTPYRHYSDSSCLCHLDPYSCIQNRFIFVRTPIVCIETLLRPLIYFNRTPVSK